MTMVRQFKPKKSRQSVPFFSGRAQLSHFVMTMLTTVISNCTISGKKTERTLFDSHLIFSFPLVHISLHTLVHSSLSLLDFFSLFTVISKFKPCQSTIPWHTRAEPVYSQIYCSMGNPYYTAEPRYKNLQWNKILNLTKYWTLSNFFSIKHHVSASI